MGSLTLNTRSGWWIAAYTDSAGRRRRHRASRDQGEGKQLLSALEGQAARERLLGIKPLKKASFREFADEFERFARSNVRSHARYESSIRHLVTDLGEIPVTQIEPLLIERFKERRIRCVTPATVNRDLQVLKRMLNLAVVWRYATENPMKYVRLYRETVNRVHYLTREELGTLLNQCQEPLRSLVSLAAYTGMRQGELLALKWADIDFENGFISVETPKNGYARKIPMNKVSREVLTALSPSIQGLVFSRPKNSPLSDRTLQSQFRRIASTLGKEGFRFHDLRHTAASWMAMAGVSVLVIKELLGHRDVRMSLRYIHLAKDQNHDAMARLEAFGAAKPATREIPESVDAVLSQPAISP